MERLKHMKESLMACVESQLTHLDTVDTKELGEAIDMIKDLEEAMYYCVIVKAMEEKDHEEPKYYQMPPMSYNYMRDMDRGQGRMYYDNPPMYYGGNGSGGNSNGGSSSSQYRESGRGSANQYGGSNGRSSSQYDEMMYDPMLECRSPKSRRMYMESKEQHHDKAAQMRELETYMQELTQDVVEMVEGSSQEENN